MENGNPVERKNWFPDIEPLFKLLSYENVPPYLKVCVSIMCFSIIIVAVPSCSISYLDVSIKNLWKLFETVSFMISQGALRNAIATFVNVSPDLKDIIWSYLEQYDLPLVVGSSMSQSVSKSTTAQVSLFSFFLIILI